MANTRAVLEEVGSHLDESMGVRQSNDTTRIKLSPVVSPKDVGRRPLKSFGRVDIEMVAPDPTQPMNPYGLRAKCVVPQPQRTIGLMPHVPNTREHALTGLRNRCMMHLLERIARHFNDAGVPLMALKGAALNLTVSNDPAERAMSDLDLMVRPEDIDAARRILEELGSLRGPPLAPT